MLTLPFSKAIVKLFTGSIVELKDSTNIKYRRKIMTKHSYTATFKRKDGFVFTKRFLASDLFEADEHALEYATKRDILYLDLGPTEE